MVKKCIVCDTDFETNTPRKLSCSVSCKRKRDKDGAAKFKKKCPICDLLFLGKYSSQKFCSIQCAHRGLETDDMVPCAHCGKQINSPKSQPRRFCNSKCYGKYYRGSKKNGDWIAKITKSNLERKFHEQYNIICKTCKGNFVSPFSSAKYCGPDCKPSKKIHELTCEYCTTRFMSSSMKRKFCSKACSGMAHRDRRTHVCLRCRKEFEEKKYRNPVFCSYACWIDEENDPLGAMRRLSIKGRNNLYKGITFRSLLESRFAKILDSEEIEWKYEFCRIPWVDSAGFARTYTPDFFLPAFGLYVEIKGYLGSKDQEKMKCVYEQHPELVLIMLFRKDIHMLERDKRMVYRLKEVFRWERK